MKILICIIILLSLFVKNSVAQPLESLKISENKRYFVTGKGDPFFWLGDTGWLLFVKLNREEVDKYLEDRRLKGFNVIQVMVVHGLKAAVDVYGDSALVGGDLSKPKVTPGSTFSDPEQYDFWDHVDYVVDKAAEKGIYMALVPIWGTNVKNGAVSRTQAAVYAKFLADRFKNKKNIIWLNGGDVKGTDSIQTWNIIGNTLKANDPNHLVTFHPFGRFTSSVWFHNEPWLDFNMFQSGHRDYVQDTSKNELHFAVDNWKFVQFDYSKSPKKPTLDGEPSYEKIPHGLHDTTQEYWNENDVRRYGYWSVFAGGCGFTYGHNSVMQFHKPTDHGSAYGAKNYWYEAINDPGGKQMIYLKKLMLSHPYLERIPDQSLVADQGTRYNYQAATHGARYAYIYTFNGRTMKVNMGKIEGAKVKASWYSPRDGSSVAIGTFQNKGILSFDPPGDMQDGNDWVLVLESL
jgi:hypothetical protein